MDLSNRSIRPPALDRLAERTAQAVRRLGRGGAVVAVSGGVDSGVVAGICVRALGPEHVLCLRLPERDAAAVRPTSAWS